MANLPAARWKTVLAEQIRNRAKWDWLILLLLALLLYLLNLGGVALRDWDESTYAIAARGMYRTGDWLHPTLLGQPYLNKPPLGLWWIASSYTLLGVNEWATRLPLAGFSALAVPLLYGVGRQLGASQERRLPALLAALVYLTLLPVTRHGRLAMLDGTMITWMLGMLFCLLQGRRRALWLVGVGPCFAAMILTKGVLALLLGGILLAFLLWDGQVKLLRHPLLWIGVALGCVPVLLWYLAQADYYGADFWQIHFLNQAFSRAWDNVDQNRGPVWYYLLELLESAWPWLLFLPGGLRLCWQQRHTSWAKLILSGTVLFLVTISLMRTKLPWYVQPLYPWLAMAIGVQLAQIWQGKVKPYPRFWLAFVLLLLLVSGVGTIAAAVTGQPILLGVGGMLSLTLAGAAWCINRQHRQFIPVLLVGMYLALGVFFLSDQWVWELNEAFAVKPVASLIQTHTPAGTIVYTSFDYDRPSLNFYSERRVLALKTGDLTRLWDGQPYLLLNQQTLQSLPSQHYTRLGNAGEFTLIQPH